MGMRCDSFVLWAILTGMAVLVALDLASLDRPESDVLETILQRLDHGPEVRVEDESGDDLGVDDFSNCSHFSDCFDIYRCGNHPRNILVHVPDPVRLIGSGSGAPIAPVSSDFVEVVRAVVESGYYTADPAEACLFFPPVDVLSLRRPRVDLPALTRGFRTSPRWNAGQNHAVMNVYPGRGPLKVDMAMRLATSMTTYDYRSGFDVAIPNHSLLQNGEEDFSKGRRKYEVLDVVEAKTKVNYPEILSEATFCLVPDLGAGESLTLSLYKGCIPVVADDSAVLPFSEVLDWKRFSLRIRNSDIDDLDDILKEITDERVISMQSQLEKVYGKYFSGWKAIVQTSLDILNDRVVPHHAKTYRDWNLLGDDRWRNPLFMKAATPKAEEGFTAVILTYDRVESLFDVIRNISGTPSLSRIVVVWNHQEKSPPPPSAWPKIGKSLKVIKTRANLLSNRFYPYQDIETEAVLSLDDDISMLTRDELEFGYQVWREFPDRLVGYPSRTHVLDEDTGKYRYESEWTSEVSMVLTGASFYHKYWHYLYTASPSSVAQDIKRWVDRTMNCEDIAMNFLIANATGNPPIKVAPRKKFKCSTVECYNQDMLLSGQYGHMVARSECINMFAERYGYMPLKTVEFRADPVLYKDEVPDKLKRFVDIGSL